MARNVRDAQFGLRRRLQEAGMSSAAMEADWIMEYATGLDRAQLLARGSQDLSSREVGVITEALRRRLAREPLQYILGEAGFFGRTFQVGPGVLIPRPETEVLVEAVLDGTGPGLRILDVGTGSGCIACTVALEAPEATITALDVSSAALTWASENARRLGARVTFVEADMFAPGLSGAVPGPFDIIVSNPPYVPEEDAPFLEPELSHEPRGALFVQGDPLRFVEQLAVLGRELLVDGGQLFIELHAPTATDAAGVLENAGFSEAEVIPDLAGRLRVIKATRRRLGRPDGEA